MVRNKCFEDVNGLYVKFTKGSPVILNLSKVRVCGSVLVYVQCVCVTGSYVA